MDGTDSLVEMQIILSLYNIALQSAAKKVR